jgi:hypothetical protein
MPFDNLKRARAREKRRPLPDPYQTAPPRPPVGNFPSSSPSDPYQTHTGPLPGPSWGTYQTRNCKNQRKSIMTNNFRHTSAALRRGSPHPNVRSSEMPFVTRWQRASEPASFTKTITHGYLQRVALGGTHEMFQGLGLEIYVLAPDGGITPPHLNVPAVWLA